jgi:tRNA-dihydrouridine synthase A
MRTPALVADCVAAMQEAAKIPVTVKCRIGVDDQDPEESLPAFAETVAKTGCNVFIVHARKAWLEGLSPKENREIPPLQPEIAEKLKRRNPDFTIVLNGGVKSLAEAEAHLANFDGVMLGRAAYDAPYMLAEVDRLLFGEKTPAIAREEAARMMIPYVQRMAREGVKPHHVTRHMLGLFHGQPGARVWRRVLSAQGVATSPDVIERGLDAIGAAALATA